MCTNNGNIPRWIWKFIHAGWNARMPADTMLTETHNGQISCQHPDISGDRQFGEYIYKIDYLNK